MKSGLKNIFLVILGVLLFLLIIKLVGINRIIGSFNVFRPIYIIPYFIVSLLIFLGFVIRWYLILRAMGVRVRFRRLIFYRIAAYFVSYVTPSAKVGGEGVRIYFLIKDCRVKLESALSSVLTDKMIELSTNAIVSVIAGMLFVASFSMPIPIRIGIIAISLAVSFLIFMMYQRVLSGKETIYKIISRLHLNRLRIVRRYRFSIIEAEKEVIRFHKNRKEVFRISVLISFILLLLSMVEFKMITLMFGYHVSMAIVFFILTVVGVAYILPLPGALGILEGGEVSLFLIVGLKGSVGFNLALLTRVRDIIWSIIGAAYLYSRNMNISKLISPAKSWKNKPRVEYFKSWKVK